MGRMLHGLMSDGSGRDISLDVEFGVNLLECTVSD